MNGHGTGTRLKHEWIMAQAHVQSVNMGMKLAGAQSVNMGMELTSPWETDGSAHRQAK